MTPSSNSIKSAVKTCIDELVSDFLRNPYAFLFESDLQASLYGSLCSKLPELVEIPCPGIPEGKYETGVVHTEYFKRIDIVCLDPKQAPEVKERKYKRNYVHIYELPILVGIEIKYRKMGDRFGLSSCLADFKKLDDIKEVEFPVVLGFLQHQSYKNSFFAGISRTAVQDIDPFSRSVYVISPRNKEDKEDTGKWKIDF